MSQQSQFSQEVQIGWIQWFCSLDDHKFFCEIDLEFIKEKFNLYGLKNYIKRYQQSLQMIMRKSAPEDQDIEDPKFLQLYEQATNLYGLIHARFIKSPLGLSMMREHYLQGKFGHCPRVLCEQQNVIPMGISEDLKQARVKVYCKRCKDIYTPKKKLGDLDGAFFGTSFPQILLMTFPDIKKQFKKQIFEPTLFGFKVVPKENQVKDTKNYQQPTSMPHQTFSTINKVLYNTNNKNKTIIY